MSKEQQSYTLEFKAQVVLETVSGDEVNPREVADKHGVDPAEILLWARQMNISDDKLDQLAAEIGAHDEGSGVEISTRDEKFASDINLGVTDDLLNLKNLFYWGTFGSVFVILIVLSLLAIYTFSTVSTVQQVAEQSEYYRVNQVKQNDQETLSSFGVVDLESGIYRIPVDSVISRMAVDQP